MLKEIGILSSIVNIYNIFPSAISSYFMGIISAFVDNIPMTAAIIKSGLGLTGPGWLSLNYSIGVGGSILAIGSAAGVVAMGKMRELTFIAYLKYSLQVLVAYTLGFIVALVITHLVYA